MVKYKYVGGKWGGSPPGYPARDITQVDIIERGLSEKVLDVSPLYQRIKRRKTSKGGNSAEVHPGSDDGA